jgi:hypothetical protein
MTATTVKRKGATKPKVLGAMLSDRTPAFAVILSAAKDLLFTSLILPTPQPYSRRFHFLAGRVTVRDGF